MIPTHPACLRYSVSVMPTRGAIPISCGDYLAEDGQAAIQQAERDHPDQPETARWWAVCEYTCGAICEYVEREQ